jgi:hypothetical protein
MYVQAMDERSLVATFCERVPTAHLCRSETMTFFWRSPVVLETTTRNPTFRTMMQTTGLTLALMAVFLFFLSPSMVDAYAPCCCRRGEGGRTTSPSRLIGDGNPPCFAEYYAARQQQQSPPPAAAPPANSAPPYYPPPSPQQQQQQQAPPTSDAGFSSRSNSGHNDDDCRAFWPTELQATQRHEIISPIKSRIPDLVVRPQLSINDVAQGYDAPGSGANIA